MLLFGVIFDDVATKRCSTKNSPDHYFLFNSIYTLRRLLAFLKGTKTAWYGRVNHWTHCSPLRRRKSGNESCCFNSERLQGFVSDLDVSSSSQQPGLRGGTRAHKTAGNHRDLFEIENDWKSQKYMYTVVDIGCPCDVYKYNSLFFILFRSPWFYFIFSLFWSDFAILGFQ